MLVSGAKLSAYAVLMAVLAPVAAQAKPPKGDVLQIDIEAKIGQRCGIAALGAKTNDSGRIDQATRIAFNFTLDCNTPFKIGVAAQHGGLQLAGTTTPQQGNGGFAYRKAYVAGLQFNTDQAGTIAAGECGSASLLAVNATCRFYGAEPGSGLYSGKNVTAIGREGELTVSWSGEDADTTRLAAGVYQETLTIIVAPST